MADYNAATAKKSINFGTVAKTSPKNSKPSKPTSTPYKQLPSEEHR